MDAHIRPVQDQDSQDFSTENGGAYEPPPLRAGLSWCLPGGKESHCSLRVWPLVKSAMISRGDDHLSHMEMTLHPWANGWHKLDSVCTMNVTEQRTQNCESCRGGSGKSWGARGSNIIKIHFILYKTLKELMKILYTLKRILVFTIMSLIATPSTPIIKTNTCMMGSWNASPCCRSICQIKKRWRKTHLCNNNASISYIAH